MSTSAIRLVAFQEPQPRNLGTFGSLMKRNVEFFRADVPGHENSTIAKTAKYVAAFFLILLLTATVVGIPLVIMAAKEVTEQRNDEKLRKLFAFNEKVAQENQEKVAGKAALEKQEKEADKSKEAQILIKQLFAVDPTYDVLFNEPSIQSKISNSSVFREAVATAALDEKQEVIFTKNGELNIARQKIAELEAHLATATTAPFTNKDLQVQLATAQARVTTLEQQLAAAPAAAPLVDNKELQDQLTAAQANVKALEEQLAASEEVKKAAEDAVIQKNLQLMTAGERIGELEAQIAAPLTDKDLQVQLANAQVNLKALEDELASAKSELEGMLDQNALLQGSKETLKKQFEAECKAKEIALRTVEELETEIKGYIARIENSDKMWGGKLKTTQDNHKLAQKESKDKIIRLEERVKELEAQLTDPSKASAVEAPTSTPPTVEKKSKSEDAFVVRFETGEFSELAALAGAEKHPETLKKLEAAAAAAAPPLPTDSIPPLATKSSEASEEASTK